MFFQNEWGISVRIYQNTFLTKLTVALAYAGGIKQRKKEWPMLAGEQFTAATCQATQYTNFIYLVEKSDSNKLDQ